MKKERVNRGLRFAICGLLVLLLSIFLIGCKDDEPEPEPDPDAVEQILSGWGYTESLPSPNGSKYNQYQSFTSSASKPSLAVEWKSCTTAQFQSYKSTWEGKRAAAQVDPNNSVMSPIWVGDIGVTMFFITTGGEADGVTGFNVDTNSILLIVTYDPE